MAWSAIVVTSRTKDYADAVKEELILRQKRNHIPNNVILLCVEDPQEGLGSGGATLNALLVVAEHLSARKKLTVVSSDVLENARILIMHLGRYYSHDPCGRAFVALPFSRTDKEMEDVLTNFDALYCMVSNQLSIDSPPGLWVCSSDMILSLPTTLAINWDTISQNPEVYCISVPATVDYAADHGVYKIDNEGKITDIIYKGTNEEIQCSLLPSSGDQSEKLVSLVSGIVFFSTSVAEKLLSLHTCAPLDACTYMGVDSGVDPLQISLYFDILLSMASGVQKEDFVGGKRGSSFGHSSSNHDRNMELARTTLWDRLRGIDMRAVVVHQGVHRYLDITSTPYNYFTLLKAEDIVKMQNFALVERSHSFVEENCTIGKKCFLINSLVGDKVTIGEGSLIAHCNLQDELKVGKNCVIIGLDAESCTLLEEIPDSSFLMGATINITGFGHKRIYCCLWNCDKISISDDIGKILSHPIEECCAPESVTRNDLLKMIMSESGPLPLSFLNMLPGGRDAERLNHNTLFMAKLFPVLHATKSIDIRDSLILLDEKISMADYQKWKSSWKFSIHDLVEQTSHACEFEYRRELSVKVACKKVNHDLINNLRNNIQPLYFLAVLTGKHNLLLSALDKAALTCVRRKKPELCARVFSCIAEVLALIAGEDAGMRSGPAANREWKDALLMLERMEFEDAIEALAVIRRDWLGHHDLLIRAARHYERAEQIFVRHACISVSQFIKTVPGSTLTEETWLVCECPARVDLAGGWSDTPPICFENGGSVVNAALMIENKRPIGASVRLIDEPVIVMTMLGESELSTMNIVCNSIENFKDYCQPQALGALLKACFVLCEIVSLDSRLSLKEQLKKRFGKGLEIQTWSDLPRGSGLGTSSILAGAIITALFRAAGRITDTNSIIHAVVMLEQMLTTGGGWQDQVGGMVGGIKCCSSKAKLPLEVMMEPIVVTDGFLKSFEDRIKLIYTGKTRLARNMLQDVLRNWYAREPHIITNCNNLISNAMRCKKAFQNGDLCTVGECLSIYWEQKKIMAPGCEPASCAELMRILRPHVLGQSLVGAGGGGFLCIILKQPQRKESLHDLLKDVKGTEDLAVYDVTVDITGMQVYYKAV